MQVKDSTKLFLAGATLVIIALWALYGTFVGIISIGVLLILLALDNARAESEAEFKEKRQAVHERIQRVRDDLDRTRN